MHRHKKHQEITNTKHQTNVLVAQGPVRVQHPVVVREVLALIQSLCLKNIQCSTMVSEKNNNRMNYKETNNKK